VVGSRRFLAARSDDGLVEQVRRGNEAAFEVLYDRHGRAILSFCRHMLGSREEAEDAVQHTFMAAYNDLLVSDRPIQLKAWLYTIARNRCLSMLRARREHSVEHVEVSTAGLADQVQERQDLRDMLADMRALPDEQRAALVLAELGDLSHGEIGQVLGVEGAKVKSLVFQARSTLIEHRDARAIPCQEIREQLATLHGGALRRGPLRKHVKACPGCREFRLEVARQRAMMAAVLPVLPTLGLKSSALAAIGGGMGGGGAAAAGAGAAAGGSAGGIFSGLGSASMVAKTAVALTVGGAAVGGGVAIQQSVNSSPPSSPPGSVEQGTAHRSPVAGDHAQGPPGTAGAVQTPNGVARRVRAHGAPANAHHGNPNASPNQPAALDENGHAPVANGHTQNNPATTPGENGNHNGQSNQGGSGSQGKSSSGAKGSDTGAVHGNPQGTAGHPATGVGNGASSNQANGAGSSNATTPTLPSQATAVHGNNLGHAHVKGPQAP